MMSRLKVLACTITVGVGGLAVFADPPAKPEAPREPLPLPLPVPSVSVKPALPAGASDTASPPTIPSKPGIEFDLDVPPLPPVNEKKPSPMPTDVRPVKNEVEIKPPTLPSREPEIAIDLPLPAAPKAPASPKPNDKPIGPPASPKLESPKVETPKPASTTPTPPVRVELPAPPALTPPAVPVPPISNSVPPLPPATMPSVPSGVPSAVPVESGTGMKPGLKVEGKLKMTLRMGDGQPRFEIRNTATTELLLKVYGEKIELASPTESKSSLAGVSATGRVRFSAPGVEGTCDQLSILSATGEVLLKGNIHLKSKGGRAWSEMTAEKMVYQIGASGLVTPKPPVRTTGFSNEDR